MTLKYIDIYKRRRVEYAKSGIIQLHCVKLTALIEMKCVIIIKMSIRTTLFWLEIAYVRRPNIASPSSDTISIKGKTLTERENRSECATDQSRC